jgi:hypothetical protein
MLFPVTLRRYRRYARTVHEDDLSDASLFLEKSRFEPFLAHGARGVRDAALIDVCNPSGIAADVDVGFRHVPLVAFAAACWALIMAMTVSPLNRTPPS